MKAYNGNNENETIRQYDNADEVPGYIQEEFKFSLFPVYIKFVGGCFDGAFESLYDALHCDDEHA